MPVQDEANVVTLGEGMTPLLCLASLEQANGFERLYVKEEGLNPTGSFKARGLSAAVSKAKELGVKSVAIPSAGNAAGALAAYGAAAGMQTYVFMPEDAPEINKVECAICGALVYLVKGLISDAGRIVKTLGPRVAGSISQYSKNGFFRHQSLRKGVCKPFPERLFTPAIFPAQAFVD